MKIEDNCVVTIEYELTQLGQNDIIDSNKNQAPLEFMTGKSQIIPGLEKELIKLEKGESADIKVIAAEAYGEIKPEAVDSLPKEQFADIKLEVGMQLFGQGEQGEQIAVTVKEFNDETVTIDYNHPLAGKDLMFSLTIKDVRPATEEEIKSGQIGGREEHGEHCGSGTCSH